MSDKLREAVEQTVCKCSDWARQLHESAGVEVSQEATVERNVAVELAIVVSNLRAALADRATPCIQKGCGKSNGHKGRHTDGTLPGHIATADTSPEPTEEIARKVWHEVWDTGDAPIDIRMAEEEFDTYWVALRKALADSATNQEIAEKHVTGVWCKNLRCGKCYSAKRWIEAVQQKP